MLALVFSVVPLGGSLARYLEAHGPAAGLPGFKSWLHVTDYSSLLEAFNLMEPQLLHLQNGVSGSPDQVSVSEGQQTKLLCKRKILLLKKNSQHK